MDRRDGQDPLAGVRIPWEIRKDPELREFAEHGIWPAREKLALQHHGPLFTVSTPELLDCALEEADRSGVGVGRWDRERFQRMVERLGLGEKQQRLLIRRPDQLTFA